MSVNYGETGGRLPKNLEGNANAVVPLKISKRTAQNSPKHAISSEKFHFFQGKWTQPSVLDPRLRPSEFTPNLRLVGEVQYGPGARFSKHPKFISGRIYDNDQSYDHVSMKLR